MSGNQDLLSNLEQPLIKLAIPKSTMRLFTFGTLDLYSEFRL